MIALERVENLISQVLRIGVAVALLIILSGVVVSFVHHPAYLTSPEALGTVIAPDRSLPMPASVVTGVMAGRGQAIVMLGLMLLIATPVARVAVSVVVFWLQRDWVFVGITLVVLGVLLVSFFLGRTE